MNISNSEQRAQLQQAQINTCGDWEKIAQATSDFHDSVIRQVDLVGDEYLDHDNLLVTPLETGATVRVLVHIQRRDIPAVELGFTGVMWFAFDRSGRTDPARCFETPDGLLRFELAEMAVIARSCTVVFVDATMLGKDYRLAE